MSTTSTVKIIKLAGVFAENKDIAREIRVGTLQPALKKSKSIVLDFNGVDAATQSFIHALVSQLIRDYGVEVLETIAFKDCNKTVQKIIEIVVDYMQHAEPAN
ncbi:MAG: STAS-like domain-containing protein [Candidatus Saccharimonadales bacterium]